MENTNSRNFRAKLSEFFDRASKNPVAIARGADRFILMNEEEFLNMKDELMSLQKNLISLLQVNEGKSETFESAEEGFNSLFEEIDAESYARKVKNKKAVG